MPRFLIILCLILGNLPTVLSQNEDNTSSFGSSLVYCNNIKMDEARLSCYSEYVNKKIKASLNENLSNLKMARTDTLSVSYKVTYNEWGYSLFSGLEVLNPAAAEVVESTLSKLEDVKPFTKPSGEAFAVSYTSERNYYLNNEGILDDLRSSMDLQLDGPADVPFATIENVPVYPGCTGDNNLYLKRCMSGKIQEFVEQNFNMEMIKSLNLPPRRYRIAVQFKVDREGNVVDIRSRADREELENEAIRVVSGLPKMKPGRQRGKEVGVLYALPIIFEIAPPTRDDRKAKRAKRKNKN